MIDSAISAFLPDYLDLVEELLSVFGSFLIAGVLFAFMLWALGYAVHAVYSWLNGWTSAREE